ncbi:MAG: hypothetical protein ACRBN8_14080 [Nannocystales bacterium]
MTLRFGLLLLTAGCAACFSDPPVPQRVSNETGTSTGEPDPVQGSSGSSGEAPGSATTSGSSSSGTPEFGCQDAYDAQSCAAASDPNFEQCSWYPTYGHDVLSCDSWATGSGACVIEEGLDGCFQPEASCPEGVSWYYRVVDGSVELVDATNLCYGLSAFTPCPWSGDPAETLGTSVGSGSSSGAESGASASVGDSGDGGTSGGSGGGTTGDGWTLQDEIEAVCACACVQ